MLIMRSVLGWYDDKLVKLLLLLTASYKQDELTAMSTIRLHEVLGSAPVSSLGRKVSGSSPSMSHC